MRKRFFGLAIAAVGGVLLWQEIVFNLPEYAKYFGNGLLVIGIIQAMIGAKSLDSFLDLFPDRKIWNSKIWEHIQLALLAVFVVFAVIFERNQKAAFLQKELLKNGILAKGWITDAQKVYGRRRSKHYYLGVLFNDQKGIEYFIEKKADEGEYYIVKIGEEIDIIYSPDNPKIMEVLVLPSKRALFGLKKLPF